MAYIKCVSSDDTLTKITGTFTSVNGSVTITVDGLSEIKKIFVYPGSAISSSCQTSIDLTDEDLPICTFGSVSSSAIFKEFGFQGDVSNVSGNTFTWYWTASGSTIYYVAYGI